MKESIYFVPIAGDFIDLEHLLHISPIEFRSAYEQVYIELRYMFQKEKVVISVRARDLFDEKDMERYKGYKLDSPLDFTAGNELGQQYKRDAVRVFEMRVRTSIADAWKKYRESKG
jgi:hypothetical protein